MHRCGFRQPSPLRATVLAFVASTCLVPSVGTADPIVVNAGFIRISSDAGDYPDRPLLQTVFSLSVWSGVSCECPPTSTVQLARQPLPTPLSAGASVNLSTTLSWTGGALSAPGFSSETGFGLLSIVAGDAVLHGTDPSTSEHDQLVGFGVPFTFTGVIGAVDPTTGATLFERELQGRGEAKLYTYTSAYFEEHNPARGALGDFFVYMYDVQPSNPIPEPATLALVGCGAALAALRARRRAAR